MRDCAGGAGGIAQVPRVVSPLGSVEGIAGSTLKNALGGTLSRRGALSL